MNKKQLSKKEIIHSVLLKEIEMRFQSLNDSLKDVLTATADDTKSSAGDKHETSRAMAQLEQEKIGGQISEMNKLQEILYRIDPTQTHSVIQLGSLVQTSNGWFYLSVGIGPISVENETIFCMTLAAPLGKLLFEKKSGDSVEWQGKSIQIIQNY